MLSCDWCPWCLGARSSCRSRKWTIVLNARCHCRTYCCMHEKTCLSIPCSVTMYKCFKIFHSRVPHVLKDSFVGCKIQSHVHFTRTSSSPVHTVISSQRILCICHNSEWNVSVVFFSLDVWLWRAWWNFFSALKCLSCPKLTELVSSVAHATQKHHFMNYASDRSSA